MRLDWLWLENFTVFDDVMTEWAPGLNVVIGDRGAGKTHLLRAVDAALGMLAANDSELDGGRRLEHSFGLPAGEAGRLIRRGQSEATVRTGQRNEERRARIRNQGSRGTAEWTPAGTHTWITPGGTSEPRGGNTDGTVKNPLARALRQATGWNLEATSGTLMLQSQDERTGIDDPLVDETTRRLACAAAAAERQRGAICWDNPECGIDGEARAHLAGGLLELAASDRQVVVATADYVLVKEVEQRSEDGQVRYHHLERRSGEPGAYSRHDRYAGLGETGIARTFTKLYNREIRRSLGYPQASGTSR